MLFTIVVLATASVSLASIATIVLGTSDPHGSGL